MNYFNPNTLLGFFYFKLPFWLITFKFPDSVQETQKLYFQLQYIGKRQYLKSYLSLQPNSTAPQSLFNRLQFQGTNHIYNFHKVTYKITVPRIPNNMGKLQLVDRSRKKLVEGECKGSLLETIILTQSHFRPLQEKCALLRLLP